MKLYQIWNAVPAFQTLHALKKNPKLAYKLLKYAKKVAAEIEICDQRRQDYVYEVSGVARGERVSLDGKPEFAEFNAKFQEFMQGESDLEPLDVTLDELVDALGAETGNVISEDQLELLEPFFKS